MAETIFATGDALTAKIWATKVFRAAMKDLWFSKWIAESSDSIIHMNTDLTKKAGDRVTFPLRMQLTGAGIDLETDDPEGNEEEIVFHDFSVTLEEKGNAVRARSKMDFKRPAFDLRNEFRMALQDWLSGYLEDKTIVALSTSPTSGENIFGGDATSTATIDSSDTMATAVISKAKRKARLHTPKIRPIRVNGKNHYVMLMHDYQSKALKAEDAWQQANREGGTRGPDNALFSGNLGMWDGVVLFEYERIQTYTGWGAGGVTTGARALLLGAQAGIHAYGQLPEWYEKLFKYNRIPGVLVDVIHKVSKTVFNSKDFGVITVDTAQTPD